MIVFLKFLLAHLIGDFLLQSDTSVTNKELRKIKSPHLYAHIAIHLLALLFLFTFDIQFIGGITLVIISHFSIDVAKLYLQNKENKRTLFFIDQLLHIIMLLIATNLYTATNIDFNSLLSEDNILLAICLLFVTYASSIIIKIIITQWSPEKNKTNNEQSLAKAGKYIGFLERLLVFTFIAIGKWEGVGFLLAAKSVFRFGDLNETKEIKLTEYVLIGTLLSFSLAILTGIVYLYYGR